MRSRSGFRASKVLAFAAGIVVFFIAFEAALHIYGALYIAAGRYRNAQRSGGRGVYTILCIGESTTALTSVVNDISWPAQLSGILNRPGSGISCAVINEGVPASDTQFLRGHLAACLDKYNPQMVISMMGINDEYIVYYSDVTGSGNFLFRHSKAFRFLSMIARDAARKLSGVFPDSAARGEAGISEAVSRLVRGNQYLKEHRYEEAEREFLASIALDPSAIDTYVDLGLTYERSWQLDKMRDAFRMAADRLPHKAEGYIGLGWYSMNVRDHESAAGYFKRALEIQPRRDDVWNGLAWACRALGRNEEALQAFEEAIRQNPLNDRAYAGMGLLCAYALSLPDKAEEYLAKASELRTARVNPVTRANYSAMVEMVRSRGITQVCMQYPLRSIEPLKAVFSPVPEGVIWIENDGCFKEALRVHGYDHLFTDMFGGEFGHCTAAGNRVIAENVAGAIEKIIRRDAARGAGKGR